MIAPGPVAGVCPGRFGGMTAFGLQDFEWRRLSRPELGLADDISTFAAARVSSGAVRTVRSQGTLLMFSDYGGAHKEARFEVLSFLVTTAPGIEVFNANRRRLRKGSLGSERRMAYKALNDKVRMRSLPAFLEAVNQIEGLLVNFAIDKRVISWFSEGYGPDTAFGTIGPWANRSFAKLSRVGHLASILIEGLRQDGQNLYWFTDEDEIAPNNLKHAEATRLIGHLLNHYCGGQMGHFRFGTTASDAGDLLIEDLTAVPDLAAGSLGEILSALAEFPEPNSVGRIFIPPNSTVPSKALRIAHWLDSASGNLQKLNVAFDEYGDKVLIREFGVAAGYRDL